MFSVMVRISSKIHFLRQRTTKRFCFNLFGTNTLIVTFLLSFFKRLAAILSYIVVFSVGCTPKIYLDDAGTYPKERLGRIVLNISNYPRLDFLKINDTILNVNLNAYLYLLPGRYSLDAKVIDRECSNWVPRESTYIIGNIAHTRVLQECHNWNSYTYTAKGFFVIEEGKRYNIFQFINELKQGCKD